jgi:hypothetical protein
MGALDPTIKGGAGEKPKSGPGRVLAQLDGRMSRPYAGPCRVLARAGVQGGEACIIPTGRSEPGLP